MPAAKSLPAASVLPLNANLLGVAILDASAPDPAAFEVDATLPTATSAKHITAAIKQATTFVNFFILLFLSFLKIELHSCPADLPCVKIADNPRKPMRIHVLHIHI